MSIERGEQVIHVSTRIGADRVEIPMDVQTRRVNLAAPQLQQRRDKGPGRRDIERRPLRHRRLCCLHRRSGVRQLINMKVRRVQPVGPGLAQAFQ